MLKILEETPSYLYLLLIIQFGQQNKLTGIQYLSEYFRRTSFKMQADQTSMVATQSGYAFQQMQSRWELPFH